MLFYWPLAMKRAFYLLTEFHQRIKSHRVVDPNLLRTYRLQKSDDRVRCGQMWVDTIFKLNMASKNEAKTKISMIHPVWGMKRPWNEWRLGNSTKTKALSNYFSCKWSMGSWWRVLWKCQTRFLQLEKDVNDKDIWDWMQHEIHSSELMCEIS